MVLLTINPCATVDDVIAALLQIFNMGEFFMLDDPEKILLYRWWRLSKRFVLTEARYFIG